MGGWARRERRGVHSARCHDTCGASTADFVFELTDGKTVLGEFDGRAKYEDEQLRAGSSTIDVLLKERQRESRLTLMDVRIVRFNWNDVRTPGRLVRMLAAAGVTRATLVRP